MIDAADSTGSGIPSDPCSNSWIESQAGGARTLRLLLRQKLNRQNGVHRSGTETLKVERDVGEAECFEDAGKLRCHFGAERALQLVPGDLDANDITMMAYAELAEPQLAHGLLTLFDYLQCLRSHGAAVFNARGEAG